MKIILKVFAAPLVAVLALTVVLCSFLLYCSAYILGLAGTLVAFLGLLVLLTGSTTNGLILLVLAFLVSPLGLPMLGAKLLGLLQDLRYAIQGRVYG